MTEHGAAGAPARSQDEQAGRATDVVCGMTVDPEDAASASHDGRTYYSI